MALAAPKYQSNEIITRNILLQWLGMLDGIIQLCGVSGGWGFKSAQSQYGLLHFTANFFYFLLPSIHCLGKHA